MQYFPANEIDVDSGPEKPGQDKCQAASLECTVLQCPYGVERFVDSDVCERCQCYDPCKDYSCPDQTQCAVDLYRNPQTGETEYRGVCRPSKLLQLGKCFKFHLFLILSVINSIDFGPTNWP
jgi:hypothetical protein